MLNPANKTGSLEYLRLKMLFKVIYFILFTSSVLSRNMPRYADLDEDDQQLFRAAYDTPTYDHDEYQEDDILPTGRLDLLKDGLWALKAEFKQLKAFNKAMCASLLATKLKVKELLSNSAPLKKHHHIEVDKKKPTYNYQAPAQAYQYNTAPQYAPEYSEPQYAPPQHTHDPYYGH